MKKTILIILTTLLSLSLWAGERGDFRREIFVGKEGDTLQYRVLLPKVMEEGKLYPLLLFLHGLGERGSDNEAQLLYIDSLLLAERELGVNEAIVFLPQCPEDDMWISDSLRSDIKGFKNLYVERNYKMTKSLKLAGELVEATLKHPYIDPTRVAAMGLSMGGMGTLELIGRYPSVYKKAVAICGGGNFESAKKFVARTSLRLYHGSVDGVVPVDLSRAMYDRVRSIGGTVDYIEYEGVDHDVWHNVFAEPGLMEWLTTQQKKVVYGYIFDVPYKYENDDYVLSRCFLDFYFPSNRLSYPTVVWFHGGGLQGGEAVYPRGV